METRGDETRRRSPIPTGRRSRRRSSFSVPVPLWVALAGAVAALAVALVVRQVVNGSQATGPTPPTVAFSQIPATASATTAPAKAVVLRQSGNGDKTTQLFTTGSAWSVAYTYDCTAMGTGFFSIDEATAVPGEIVLEGVTANVLGTKGGDKTYGYHSGQHALRITSGCAWTITVTDGDSG